MKTHEQFLIDFEKNGNKNLEICDTYKGCEVPIDVKCKVCNLTFKMTPHSLLKGYGCKYCSNQLIVPNINSFAAVHPELMNFVVNKAEAYLYSAGSKHNCLVQCPTCKTQFSLPYYKFSKIGFYCSFCNNMSYPNKFLRVILSNLSNIDNLTFEKTYLINGKQIRYDAFFEYQSKQFVIEINGGQHYKDCSFNGYNVENQINQDKLKEEYAVSNHMIYICIDAKKSDFLYIKQHFIESILSSYIDLEGLDWYNLFIQFNNYSLLYNVCLDYDNNLRISELAKKYKLDRHQISNLLDIGKVLKLCHTYQKGADRKGVRVEAYDNEHNFIGSFPSASVCARELNKKYDLNFLPNSISHVLSGAQKSHRNFYFERSDLNE